MDLFSIPKEEIINRIERLESFDGGNEEVLYWAAINGYNDVLHKLINANKSDTNKFPLQVNKLWNLALRYAAIHGQKDSIKILLEAGADTPAYDYVLVTKYDSKIKKYVLQKTLYPSAISPECGVKNPERYNFLWLDWIMDNCTTDIFEMLKKHIEEKNPSFHYTSRAIDKETLEYLPRYTKVQKKKKTTNKRKDEEN